MGVIGRLLRGVHAGEAHLAWNEAAVSSAPATISLVSSAFENGGHIPQRHAGKGVGENISPQLSWSNVPANTAELILIVEDPGAPIPRPIVHCVVTGILPAISSLAEGALSPPSPIVTEHYSVGRNTFGKTLYAGPRPIPDHGPHTYVFQLFALDRRVLFKTPPRRDEVIRRIQGTVIARGRLDGIYERNG